MDNKEILGNKLNTILISNYLIDNYENLIETSNTKELSPNENIITKLIEIKYYILRKKLGIATQLGQELFQLVESADKPIFLLDLNLFRTEIHLKNQDLTESIKFLDNIKNILDDLELSLKKTNQNSYQSFLIRKLRYYYLKTLYYYLSGDYKSSEKLVNKLDALAYDLDIDILKLDSIIFSAKINRNAGNLKKALELAEKTKPFLAIFSHHRVKSEIYSLLGTVYEVNGKPKDAIESFEKALVEARQLHYLEDKLAPINNLGLMYWQEANVKEALKLLLEAEEIAGTTGFKKELGLINTNLGLIYGSIGQSEKALEHNFKALNNPMLSKDLRALSLTYNIIGTIYDDIGNLVMAEEYFLKSIKTSAKIGFLYNEITSTCNLMEIYYINNEIDKFKECFSKILQATQDKMDEKAQGIATFAKAFWYQIQTSLSDKEKSLYYYKKLMNNEKLWYEIRFEAFLRYCQVDYEKFILFGIKLSWEIIESYLDYIINKTYEQNFIVIHYKGKIIQGKLLTIKSEFSLAEKIFSEVICEAKETGFENIVQLAQNQLRTLDKHLLAQELELDKLSGKKEKEKDLQNEVLLFFKTLQTKQ